MEINTKKNVTGFQSDIGPWFRFKSSKSLGIVFGVTGNRAFPVTHRKKFSWNNVRMPVGDSIGHSKQESS